MKAVKILAILFAIYVAIVAIFESLLGYFQPANESTIVITTFDEAGNDPRDRVVARVDADGKLYVAANHWPRAWYRRLLDNPTVQVVAGGERADYVAVEIDDAEYARANGARPLGPVFRILTGFPPRRIVRLDPT
jgi:hypothetical protein